jgi:YVTN family beta-propeller protein
MAMLVAIKSQGCASLRLLSLAHPARFARPWPRSIASIGGRKRFAACLGVLALTAFALTGCRTQDLPQYAPDYREYAYVTNGDSGTVSVLDVVNVRLDREIAVGRNPLSVAASPTRNEVYVLNSGAANEQGSLSVINTENNSVAATIALHRRPVSIEIDSTGDLAYVANSGSNLISVLDLKNRKEIAAISAGEEPAVARLSHDGKTLVVANRHSNSVTLIDTAARSIRSVFDGCAGASDAVTLPDSSKAFVACTAGHQVMAIALAGHGQSDRLEAVLDVGQAPVQLALKPDGGEVFVLNSLSNSVSEIYTGTDEVGNSYMIGDDPVRGLVSSDNALLYVANLHSQFINVYGIDDGKRLFSIHVGDGPSALAFSTAGHLLFAVDNHSGDVAVFRTATRTLFSMLPAGRSPNAIAVKAFKVR